MKKESRYGEFREITLPPNEWNFLPDLDESELYKCYYYELAREIYHHGIHEIRKKNNYKTVKELIKEKNTKLMKWLICSKRWAVRFMANPDQNERYYTAYEEKPWISLSEIERKFLILNNRNIYVSPHYPLSGNSFDFLHVNIRKGVTIKELTAVFGKYLAKDYEVPTDDNIKELKKNIRSVIMVRLIRHYMSNYGLAKRAAIAAISSTGKKYGKAPNSKNWHQIPHISTIRELADPNNLFLSSRSVERLTKETYEIISKSISEIQDLTHRKNPNSILIAIDEKKNSKLQASENSDTTV